jgi:hypothetical protein
MGRRVIGGIHRHHWQREEMREIEWSMMMSFEAVAEEVMFGLVGGVTGGEEKEVEVNLDNYNQR